MPERILYEYALIRYVPQVEREEFLNVGIILYSKRANYIALRYHIDVGRIMAFNPNSDIPLLQDHLEAFKKIANGVGGCGPISNLDIQSRFKWLTAMRSSVIQTSRPHPGLSENLDNTVAKLFSENVLLY